MKNLKITTESDDLELKRLLVNRRKRMYLNILRRFEERNKKAIVSDEMLIAFKNCYNDFVFEDAKEEYLKIKMEELNGSKEKI